MGIPFNHNRVTDGIIRSLRYSGVYATDNTAQTLRELNNNLTDAEIDAIAAGLDYGAAAAGKVTSTEDVYIMVDSDNLPATGHRNFLRITRGMDSFPISDPRKQLATVYFDSTHDTSASVEAEMVIGPDTVQLQNNGINDTYATGRLFLGSQRDNIGVCSGSSVLEGGRYALEGSPGFLVRASDRIQLRANDAVEFWYDERAILNGGSSSIVLGDRWILGGFKKYNSWSLMFIGDFDGTMGGSEALLTAKNGDHYEVVTNSALGGRVVRFRTENANYDMGVEINAAIGGGGGDRSRASNMNPKFIVYSDSVNGDVDDAIVSIRGLIDDYSGNMLLMRNDDTEGTTQKGVFIRCQTEHVMTPDTWVDRFIVWNTGDVWLRRNLCAWGNVDAHGSVNPGSGCDVAEWVQVPESCAVGDVIVMDTDGVYKKSTTVADAKVVGVVAEQPGVNLGRDLEVENQYPVAVCGFVHVNCTTVAGAIIPGDLLVSGPEGKAQKANETPLAGTILGKAMEALEQPGEDTETGLIEMLAVLQ